MKQSVAGRSGDEPREIKNETRWRIANRKIIPIRAASQARKADRTKKTKNKCLEIILFFKSCRN